MSNGLFLNTLLHMSNEDLSKTKIKFNQNNGTHDPLDIYLENPHILNTDWLFWRTENRFFNPGEIAISLVYVSWDTWLLTTIKSVDVELGIKNGINYEGEEIARYTPFFGRVLLKYHKSHIGQVRKADGIMMQLEVLQILPSIFDGISFPGYENVRLTYQQLSNIVNRRRSDWITALSNQKAVYLITDTASGEQYVGSAYGDNGMLLQRWSNYVSTGHGGNKMLEDIVNSKGIKYLRDNFQYSILENYNARTDKEYIIRRESWWKTVLGTRAHGLNLN